MKKKIILLLAFIINLSYICFAQQNNRSKKVEAVQKAYLTKELDLTPEEAENFWPVFNNYKQEIIKSRIDHKGSVIAQEEKILNVRKKFQPEFKRVLKNENRVNKLYQAEKNFSNMMRKELMERRGNRGGGKPFKN